MSSLPFFSIYDNNGGRPISVQAVIAGWGAYLDAAQRALDPVASEPVPLSVVAAECASFAIDAARAACSNEDLSAERTAAFKRAFRQAVRIGAIFEDAVSEAPYTISPGEMQAATEAAVARLRSELATALGPERNSALAAIEAGARQCAAEEVAAVHAQAEALHDGAAVPPPRMRTGRAGPLIQEAAPLRTTQAAGSGGAPSARAGAGSRGVVSAAGGAAPSTLFMGDKWFTDLGYSFLYRLGLSGQAVASVADEVAAGMAGAENCTGTFVATGLGEAASASVHCAPSSISGFADAVFNLNNNAQVYAPVNGTEPQLVCLVRDGMCYPRPPAEVAPSAARVAFKQMRRGVRHFMEWASSLERLRMLAVCAGVAAGSLAENGAESALLSLHAWRVARQPEAEAQLEVARPGVIARLRRRLASEVRLEPSSVAGRALVAAAGFAVREAAQASLTTLIGDPRAASTEQAAGAVLTQAAGVAVVAAIVGGRLGASSSRPRAAARLARQFAPACCAAAAPLLSARYPETTAALGGGAAVYWLVLLLVTAVASFVESVHSPTQAEVDAFAFTSTADVSAALAEKRRLEEEASEVLLDEPDQANLSFSQAEESPQPPLSLTTQSPLPLPPLPEVLVGGDEATEETRVRFWRRPEVRVFEKEEFVKEEDKDSPDVSYLNRDANSNQLLKLYSDDGGKFTLVDTERKDARVCDPILLQYVCYLSDQIWNRMRVIGALVPVGREDAKPPIVSRIDASSMPSNVWLFSTDPVGWQLSLWEASSIRESSIDRIEPLLFKQHPVIVEPWEFEYVRMSLRTSESVYPWITLPTAPKGSSEPSSLLEFRVESEKFLKLGIKDGKNRKIVDILNERCDGLLRTAWVKVLFATRREVRVRGNLPSVRVKFIAGSHSSKSPKTVDSCLHGFRAVKGMLDLSRSRPVIEVEEVSPLRKAVADARNNPPISVDASWPVPMVQRYKGERGVDVVGPSQTPTWKLLHLSKRRNLEPTAERADLSGRVTDVSPTVFYDAVMRIKNQGTDKPIASRVDEVEALAAQARELAEEVGTPVAQNQANEAARQAAEIEARDRVNFPTAFHDDPEYVFTENALTASHCITLADGAREMRHILFLVEDVHEDEKTTHYKDVYSVLVVYSDVGSMIDMEAAKESLMELAKSTIYKTDSNLTSDVLSALCDTISEGWRLGAIGGGNWAFVSVQGLTAVRIDAVLKRKKIEPPQQR